MMGSMANEIADAAAARQRKRQLEEEHRQRQQRSTSQVSTGTFSNESIGVGVEGNSVSKKDDKTAPLRSAIPASTPFQATRPRGMDDPPGWNSKLAPNNGVWMEQKGAQKLQGRTVYSSTVNTLYRRPYTPSRIPNDDDSFHAPLSSWVPQLRDPKDDTKTDNTTTTRWQSAATRNAMDTAVPRKSWKPPNNRKRRRKPNDNDPSLLNESYNEYSWAPHLHPQGPHALHPYPPGTSRSTYDEDDYDIDETVDEEEEEGEEVSVTDGAKHTKSRSTSYMSMEEDIISQSESELFEVVDESSSDQSGSQISAEDNDGSDTTDAFFAAKANNDKAANNRGSNGDKDGDGGSQGSTKQSAASEENMERGEPDFTTFLVDAEDTFQVFDSNWNFAPSKGTLCVLCLLIVLALEGVAVGLYFALR